ncbi:MULTISPECIES: phage holin family protein [Niastella]|uniref:Phage holin family protein n=1 Tax=Niastella soli TaxID=2821487 RepID=A0ABS3YUV2_9BACT|nr:phage holin family protein [Niastella soli]MBO9200966.1 phage holin family protein [Niastella soli]
MSESFKKWEGLTDHVKEYINIRVELAKLAIAEKTSRVVSQIIAVTIVTLFFLFVLVFGSIAGAWALSDWIGKPYAGFLIVAGIYMLLGIIVWVTRSRLIRFPIMNAIIKQLHNNDEEEQNS